jgi:hypothetical protein
MVCITSYGKIIFVNKTTNKTRQCCLLQLTAKTLAHWFPHPPDLKYKPFIKDIWGVQPHFHALLPFTAAGIDSPMVLGRICRTDESSPSPLFSFNVFYDSEYMEVILRVDNT